MEESAFNYDSTEKMGPRGLKVSGIGYVTMPKDIDRDNFIINCINSGTISFITEDSERFDNVKVSKNLFNFIQFPKEETQANTQLNLGSLIFWVKSYNHNFPIVIAILSKEDEFININEHEFVLNRNYLGNFVEIRGNAKNSNLNINIISKEDSKGSLNIKVSNKEKNAKANIFVEGNLEAYASNEAKIYSGNKLITEVINFKDKTKSIKTTITKEGIVDNEGDEPILRGNKTVDLINKLIRLISQATVSTSLGQMPLLNAIEIAKLESETKELKSELSFIK